MYRFRANQVFALCFVQVYDIVLISVFLLRILSPCRTTLLKPLFNAGQKRAVQNEPITAQTLSIEDIANCLKRSRKNAVQPVIDALEELGMVQQNEGLFRLVA